jgi:predicted regulator of Ras-like GTPase activity (Roadblock/LC7/MglB family)
MVHPSPDASEIRERLLTLQQGYPIVEGLMLVTTGGFVLASTFDKADSVSRLAAVSRTLFLLADDMCREFGRGEMHAVHLTYKRGMGGDDNSPSRVILRTVGATIMLLMVLHAPVGGPGGTQETLFLNDVERVIGYIAHQITFEA